MHLNFHSRKKNDPRRPVYLTPPPKNVNVKLHRQEVHTYLHCRVQFLCVDPLEPHC